MDQLAFPMRPEEFLASSQSLFGGQTPRNILLRALWVLRDPVRWDRYNSASNSAGERTGVNAPDAQRWSLEGAVAAASNPDGILAPYFMKLLDAVILELYKEDGGPGCFEEYCSHDAIVRILQHAAERAPG